jgi:hypothetical protein
MRGKDYPKIGPASIPASIHQGEDSRAGRDEMLLGLAITPLPEKHITNLAFLAAIKSCFHAANMSHSVLYLMSWAEFFPKGAKKIQAMRAAASRPIRASHRRRALCGVNFSYGGKSARIIGWRVYPIHKMTLLQSPNGGSRPSGLVLWTFITIVLAARGRRGDESAYRCDQDEFRFSPQPDRRPGFLSDPAYSAP